MQFKQISKETSYKFSNGMIVNLSNDDVTVFDQDNEIVISVTRKEALTLTEVLSEIKALIEEE